MYRVPLANHISSHLPGHFHLSRHPPGVSHPGPKKTRPPRRYMKVESRNFHHKKNAQGSVNLSSWEEERSVDVSLFFGTSSAPRAEGSVGILSLAGEFAKIRSIKTSSSFFFERPESFHNESFHEVQWWIMLNWKLGFFWGGGNDLGEWFKKHFYESTTTNTPILGRFLRLRNPSESEPQSFTSEIHFRCTLSSTERNRSLAEITPSPDLKRWFMVWASPVRIAVYRPSVPFRIAGAQLPICQLNLM